VASIKREQKYYRVGHYHKVVIHFIRISIANNGITKKSLPLILPLLDPKRNPPLRGLNISNNKFGKQGCTELAHTLETNPTLQALFIEGCDAKTEGASKVLQIIYIN
jgi:Ran GTPase-activating protein (RanGAP) involved in mRNA processing and transport